MSTFLSSPDTRRFSLAAQIIVRRYAADTNGLICGENFRIAVPPSASDEVRGTAHALADFLHGWGAFPTLVEVEADDDTTVDAALGSTVTFRFCADNDELCCYADTICSYQHSFGGEVDESLDGEIRKQLLTSPYSDTPMPAPQRIAWARQLMPVTRAAVQRIPSDLLKGLKIGLSLVLEPKTAALALELQAAGATVSTFAHGDEYRVDVADYLESQGIPVFGKPGISREEELPYAQDFLAQELNILLDDGSHLIRLAHDTEKAPTALAAMIGMAEETTSGLRPLYQMNAELKVPVVASNNARSKTLFDNAYGTGQSCLTTMLDLLDPAGLGIDMSKKTVVVFGYGDVGRGFARLVRAMGARVCVIELDPIRALQARMDGNEVGHAKDLVPTASWLISATGERSTITVDHLRAAHSGTIIGVIGGVDDEVTTSDALAAGASWEPAFESTTSATPESNEALVGDKAAGRHEALRAVEHLRFPDGHFVTVIDRGGCMNCTVGEGNPIQIMDLSFGVQASAILWLLKINARIMAGPEEGRAADRWIYSGLQELEKQDDLWVAQQALSSRPKVNVTVDIPIHATTPLVSTPLEHPPTGTTPNHSTNPAPITQTPAQTSKRNPQ